MYCACKARAGVLTSIRARKVEWLAGLTRLRHWEEARQVCMWVGQHLYWMENRTFALSLRAASSSLRFCENIGVSRFSSAKAESRSTRHHQGR